MISDDHTLNNLEREENRLKIYGKSFSWARAGVSVAVKSPELVINSI